jgi:hypothetical protein
MPTCREIITSGYRMAGVKDAAASLSALDGQVGMELLQEIYLEMLAKGLFGRMADVRITANYTAEEQDRIFVDTADAVSVTIPDTIEDAETGEDRSPKDYAVVTVTDGQSDSRELYLFDRVYGAWTRIDQLTLDDYAPLSGRFPSGLRAHVALKRAAEDGFQVSPVLARQAAMMNLALASRYDSPASAISNNYF